MQLVFDSNQPNLAQPIHSIVIGAGFGGMASCLRLRALGHRVTLLERGASLGGRARVVVQDGFCFDAGPTVLTAPELFAELFALFGKKREDYITFLPVTPWYRMQFNDGRFLDYGADLDDTVRQAETFAKGDGQGYLNLLAHAEALYKIGYEQLADVSFDSLTTLLKATPQMLKLRCDRSVVQLVNKHLKSPEMRQAFSVHPLLVGGNPLKTTSIYCLIHSLERRGGVWFAQGGTGALVMALAKLMAEEGVTTRLNADVKQILFHDDTVKEPVIRGVLLHDGAIIEADNVVCNVDPPHVYQHMLGAVVSPRWHKNRVKKMHYSMGLFVVFFGTRGRYENIKHHTILFGGQFERELTAVFDKHELEPNFSLYLHRPTATDSAMAPADCDAFYALVAVPNCASKLDWAVEGPALQERVFDRLEATLMPGLRQRLLTATHHTPTYFRDELNTFNGSGFSIAPEFTQSAWFRFHNKAEGLKNLYFVGAGTHPGAGVPGVINSAKVLERLLRSKRHLSAKQ
jgi:phytoene desaturase